MRRDPHHSIMSGAPVSRTRGRLHHELLHAERRQPIPQRQQPRDRRRNSATCCSRERPLRHPHVRGHLLRIHIKRRRAPYNHFHLHSINAVDKIVAEGSLRTNDLTGVGDYTEDIFIRPRGPVRRGP